MGLASIITQNPQEATAVESAFEQLMRAEVSNPPAFGARVAAAVLEDGELRAEWARNLSTMSSRTEEMRWALFDGLKKLSTLFSFVSQEGPWYQVLTKWAFLETPGSWDRIVKQTGMFCLLGLTREQVVELRGMWRILNIGYYDAHARSIETYHIYMAENSRISIAGLNWGNVQYVAECIDQTIRPRTL